VALFEGDSARVWKLLHEDRGALGRALAYIKTNGTFDDDPESEAQNDLKVFLRELLPGFDLHGNRQAIL